MENATKNIPSVSMSIHHSYGYPTYKRRDDGRTIKIDDVSLNNRWVVSYNPYLSRKFNTYINVEIYSQIRVIKYLYKIYTKDQIGQLSLSKKVVNQEMHLEH